MKIAQLQLHSRDLTAQQVFYNQTLGLPAHRHANELRITAGATELIFVPAPSNETGVYHFAFNIPENQFADAKAWLSTRVPLHRAASGQDEFDFRDWNAHAIYAIDPDGNIIELIARHGLPNANDKPFAGTSLLNISEIGLVTPNVRAQVEQLITQYGLPIYDGAGSDAFTAVGDEYGLFIVVAENRLWYPDTDIPAIPMHTVVTFEGENGLLTHLFQIIIPIPLRRQGATGANIAAAVAILRWQR